uniref:Adenosylcobinamide-GDP ribazoletransferase n=1 Tax=Ignisphaera aggregans TaxID=334771 RepID=A0A7C4FDM6_9CREN
MELNSKSLARGFRALLSFLTTLPVGSAPLSEASREFHLVSVVGLIEGCIIGLALYALLHVVKDGALLASLYIAIHIALTRGLHLDGFADYSDAIGSLRRGAEAVKVMKDPRKGAFAVILLFLNLTLSYSSISSLTQVLDPLTLLFIAILIYVLCAESMYILSALGAPEPYAGLAKEFVESAKRARNVVKNIVVTVLTLLLPIMFNVHLMLIAFTTLATVLACLVISHDVSKRLGFVNGDALGFCYETVRIVNLVIASVLCRYL